MTLRARLLVALLALALIPTLLFTAFALRYLNQAMGLWYRPGVDHALEGAVEVTKHSLARLETTALIQAGDWAAAWPKRGLTGPLRAEIANSLRGGGLDFLQVYRRSSRGWSRVEQVMPEGVLAIESRDLGAAIPPTLPSTQLLRDVRGVIAAASPLPSGEVLVAGMWVPPDFHEQIEGVVRGMTYYRQLGVYVNVQPWIFGLTVAAVALGIVALAVVLANAFAREMSRPLSELSGALEQVAAGALGTRVIPRGAVELRSLGQSFNSMTERLEAAREALQQAEREAAWRDVARKLAHEFKNMLTPMQLSLQLLECHVGSAGPEQRRAMAESLEAAMREVDHLSRLAEQFSQYARLPEPNFERLDLAEVVRNAARMQADPRIRVDETPAAAPVARGDRLLLSRAVHNLILNACEASAPGAEVEVRVAADAGEARVEVLDRGPGLPEGLGERLFEPYVSTKQRGSGLGLSLVRDIARQHGGTVTVENRPGGGVRACLSVPLATADRSGATSA